ncbi:uncharacterized protein LOC124141356 [Haliotis rufescens]|uniref:uncharacterized protein LOC124141356 n=1 Tax=Haliotis rufescens TaxID=6454 RepID=UPI00201F43D6|nr:uncharacterized protein LOC124141356 [Haliotis rufescens]
MGQFDDLSPEEREQVKKFRDRGFLALKKICLIQLGLASISVITGIVAVSFAAKNPQFPYIIAAPVWSGVLVAIGAACGSQASTIGFNKDDVATKVKALVILHYVFNVLCITICIASAVFGILGVVFCRSSDVKLSARCIPDTTALIATSGVSTAVGLLLSLFCILGTCYFCCYARSLGFKSKREMQRQMKAMQRQLAEARAQVAASQGQTYNQGQGNYYAGQGSVNEGYSKW